MFTAKDPVCGMTVDEKRAVHKEIYDNKVYYFCSSTCQTEFIKNSSMYLQGTSETRHAAHYGGYCGTSGCGAPSRGVAWYLYFGLLFLLLLLLLLVR